MQAVNVLYLIRTRSLGGAHTILRLLLQHMPQEEFRIHTATYDAPGKGDQDFINYLREDGIKTLPERIPWQGRTRFFSAHRAIQQLIQQYDIQLVHSHDTLSNILVGLRHKHYSCATVASTYGWWAPRWRLQSRLQHYIENHWALPHFDRICTASNTTKQNVLSGGTLEDRIQVIHTGLDYPRFEGGASREDTRKQLHIADDALVIGTVSRLTSGKGHLHLLKAFRTLSSECPALHLLIVGVGPLQKVLRHQAWAMGIRNKVTFAGYYNDLPGALRAMDIFCQPSTLEEGFPTSVLEAQAMELPVVASNIGGMFETLDVPNTGVLCRPGDARALAATLRPLLTAPEKRHAMGEKASSWIRQSFTLDTMIEKMVLLYRKTLETHPS